MKKLFRKEWFFWGLVLMQISLPLPAQAEAASVTGTIQSIAQAENGQITLTVENEGVMTSFLVDANTFVQGTSAAKQLKKGRRVLAASGQRGGGGGGKGPKMPFQNMTAKQRKMMGLPDLPKIPEVPQIPEIPKIPKIPTVPKVAVNTGAGGAGGGGAAAGEEAAEADAKKEKGAQPGEQKPGPQAKQRPQPAEVTPDKDTLAKLIPDKPIYKSGEPSPFEIKQIVNLKTTPKGIEVELKGKTGPSEKWVVGPDDTFVEVLDFKELKQGMKVSANLLEADAGAVAQQITVL